MESGGLGVGTIWDPNLVERVQLQSFAGGVYVLRTPVSGCSTISLTRTHPTQQASPGPKPSHGTDAARAALRSLRRLQRHGHRHGRRGGGAAAAAAQQRGNQARADRHLLRRCPPGGRTARPGATALVPGHGELHVRPGLWMRVCVYSLPGGGGLRWNNNMMLAQLLIRHLRSFFCPRTCEHAG